MADLTPKEYFTQKVPENLKSRAASMAKIQACYQFNITGESGGTWTLDLKKPGGEVREGAAEKADCTITMEDKNFVKLVSGNMNPQLAFMTGKLKVAGSMGLALKLQSIL